MNILFHFGRIAMLVGVVSGISARADISFPVYLDPFLPGGSLVAAYTVGGNLEYPGYESPVLAIQGPVQGVNASAFGFLTNGAMGAIAVGNPGSAAAAEMFVNLDFTGTGTNIKGPAFYGVNFDVTANSGVQGNPILNGVQFSAGAQCLSVDPVNRTTSFYAGKSVSENSTDFGEENGPGNLSFPIDLSYQFNVDPQNEHFQLFFSIRDTAIGSAYIDAGHTGLISINLAPGVTMSPTNGFLTTPGDVTLPPGDYAQVPGQGSAVPEPSMLGVLGLGLVALIGRRIHLTRSQSNL